MPSKNISLQHLKAVLQTIENKFKPFYTREEKKVFLKEHNSLARKTAIDILRSHSINGLKKIQNIPHQNDQQALNHMVQV